MSLKLSSNMYVSADIQYFAVSNRVYVLSNNVGIHFVSTYYFPIRSFRLVPMFSGNTPERQDNSNNTAPSIGTIAG